MHYTNTLLATAGLICSCLGACVAAPPGKSGHAPGHVLAPSGTPGHGSGNGNGASPAPPATPSHGSSHGASPAPSATPGHGSGNGGSPPATPGHGAGNGGSPSSGGSSAVRNFIYIVPDGYGQHSQTMARDYAMLLPANVTASNPGPAGFHLAADPLVVGTVRTWASDNLITDSAASGTAFACGHKSYNDAVGVTPDGLPVGSILETAKLAGFKTGLVVTSTINHATPAVYASHVENRNSYEAIAAQEIGYSHPFGSVVDILLGGGRCYFKPQNDSTSCRSDDLDLFGFAESKGFTVMQDRAAFDELALGENAPLPYIGLFNDDQMMYEIDRSKTPEQEPSLLEMVETALVSLDKAISGQSSSASWNKTGKPTPSGPSEKGYFIMIEASRIDHAGHANDAASHVHETLMYNSVMDFVRKWIDEHPDTMMMSAADHECGGLTTNGFDPSPLTEVQHSFEYLGQLWENFNGSDRRAFFVDTILPGAGLADTPASEVDALLANEEELFTSLLPTMQADKAGVNWSTGGHTASDINLHAYTAGEKPLRELKADLAGNHDNTELPRYIEKVLGLNMDETTRKLRAVDGSFVASADEAKRLVRKSRDGHGHAHDHAHAHAH